MDMETGNDSLIKRIFIIVMMLLMVVFPLSGCRIQYVDEDGEEESTEEEIITTTEPDQFITLRLWYSDEELEPYLSLCAREYEKANRNVTVTFSLISEADYVNTLTNEALSSDTVDLYIIGNDNLEQMKLAGIAEDNRMTDIYNAYNYAQTALNACTYKGQLIAYPLTFDTTFVLYNADLVGDTVLRTFDDIKNFADGYEVPVESNISTIFSCELEDIFFNYGYLGAYLDIGGPGGDDTTVIFNITPELSEAITLYQQLIKFFNIDMKQVDYYSCMNGFESGAIMLTVGDMSIYSRMKDMQQFKVGVLPFPDMTSTIATSPLSVTTAVVVNPFSENVSVAESFAKYITYTNADRLYEETGFVSCKIMEYADANLNGIYESYKKSTPKLKLMYSDEFYALLEVSMHLMAQEIDDVQALSAVSGYLESHWSSQ